jgi:hypothetical protein
MDTATMREAAGRLLGENAELPDAETLETLTLMLRGMLMVAVPEVLSLASSLPADDVPAACARAGVGQARARLDMEPRPGLPAGIAHGQRLARSVVALCDHYENLRPATTWRQICRWCDTDITDPAEGVVVALKSANSAGGYVVWAHKIHARFVRGELGPNEMLAPPEGGK